MSENRFATRFNTRAIPVLNREFGVATVRLARGTLISDPMTARRSVRVTASQGVELNTGIQVEQREYLLPISGCILDGITTQPLVGDFIIEDSEQWEVFVPDEATQAVQESSTSHDWITQVRRVYRDGYPHC